MPASLQDRSGLLGQQLALSSPAFVDGEDLPRIYTADGSDLSPPLHWNGVPSKTNSFVLFFEDLDSAERSWVHWLLFDIPADLRGLPAGVQPSPYLDNGSRHGLSWGVSEFSRLGYQGPTLRSTLFTPISEHQYPRHHLLFTLIALGKLWTTSSHRSPPTAVRRQ